MIWLIGNKGMLGSDIEICLQREKFNYIVSDKEVDILIWERGAGFTMASGSSSSAVASMMLKKKLTGNNVTVKMPGGYLKINIDKNWEIKLCGEVRQIAEGYLDSELLEDLKLS